MTMHKHVTVVAVLHIVLSSLLLLAAILVFGVLTGIGILSGEPEALAVLGIIGTAVSVFMLVLSLPGIVGGVGLLGFRPWARIVMLVVGFLSLLNIPIGTALGIYTIWVLMNDETEALFRNRGQMPPPPPATTVPPPPPAHP